MYRRVRRRRIRLRIGRRFIILIMAVVAAFLFVLFIISGFSADSDEVNEYIEESFQKCFEEISGKALDDMDSDACPDAKELARLKNDILTELRSEFSGLELIFVEHENSGRWLFSILRVPVIVNVDANISGYFKQELKDPEGNMGLYSIRFIAVAETDSADGDFVCEAECLVFQQIVKGSAPYLMSDELLE